MNRKLSLTELNRLSPEDYKSAEKNPIVIVLDNIRSMHNVGSVFRTADAFRIEKVILGGFTPKPPHRDIRKTALGATETVEWFHVENTLDAITELKNQGYQIAVVEQTENSVDISDWQPSRGTKLCLVLGNEVEGVDQTLVDLADICLEIPQFGTKHSLNVSVCAGIVMWEAVREGVRRKA